jgi:hypothetical protein
MERGDLCVLAFEALGQPGDDTLKASFDLGCTHPQRSDPTLFEQELVTTGIAPSSIGVLVDFAIHLYCD